VSSAVLHANPRGAPILLVCVCERRYVSLREPPRWASKEEATEVFDDDDNVESMDGLWWPVHAPERTNAGRLEVSDDAVSLRLAHTDLAQALETRDDSTYYGTSNGRDVTLWDCVGGFGEYSVGSAWIGVHAADDRITRIELRLAHLEDWLRPRARFITDPARPTRVRLDYALPDAVVAELDGLRIRLEWVYQTAHSPMATTLQHRAWFNIDLAEPVSFKDAHQDVIRPLHNLLTLALDRSVAIDRLFVTLSASKDARRPQRARVESAWLVARGRDTTEVFPDRFTFRFDDIADDFTGTLRRWLATHATMSAACDLFFGNHYAPPQFLETRFLVHCQAAEALHGHSDRFTHLRRAPDVHEELVQSVVKVAPEGFRSWVEGVLRNSNQKPLHEQLRELVEDAPPVVQEVIGDPNAFARDVSSLRNPWVHGGVAGADDVADRAFGRNEQLRLVLHGQFMRELGLTNEVIEARLRDARITRQVRHFAKPVSSRGGPSG
jgi:hypothetical protein